ncbi:MAG: TlpA family protein disulfide reductase [Bacteroidetes Order II. Incertae sedis bacterium]|nr:TlpA family protein disulfide reductase [Bacteroidetes Order II. bacterium]
MGRIIRFHPLTLGVIFLLTTLTSCTDSTQPQPPGSQAKQQTQLLISSPEVKKWIGEQKGKVVFLNLWATWCPPCIRELPALATFAEKNPDVAVLALSLDDPVDKGAEVQQFLKKNNLKLTFRQLDSQAPDQDLSFLDPSLSDVLPTTYVIRKDGSVMVGVQGEQSLLAFQALLAQAIGS